MSLAPILLLTYNRPSHTRQTLEALLNNKLANESDLIVFSDGSKGAKDKKEVDAVHKLIRSIDGFKSIRIVENDKNIGLANNVIKGVTEIVNEYGKVIVVEDDLVASPYFLTFMNQSLDLFENTDEVGHIQGYCYPIPELPETFFTQWIGSWGWATWKRAWQYFIPNGQELMDDIKQRKLSKIFDFNGKYPFTRMLQRQIDGENNSWAIRWYASLFLKGKVSLNAGRSLVQNIGFDNSGTHCDDDDIYRSSLYTEELRIVAPGKIEEDMQARRLIEKFHGKTYSFKAKALRRINRYLRTR